MVATRIALAAPGAKGGRDILEIGHGACTSIQACGMATTTLAWPKPSGVKSSTLRSASAMRLAHQILAGDAEMSRAGGELLTISEAERKAISTPSMPASVPR